MRRNKVALPGPDDVLRQTLPNGITVLARENFASPSVVLDGYLIAGSEDDPQDQEGLASLAVDVMERGTHRRPFEQLYEEVESVGATFGFSAGVHSTAFGAKGLAEQLPLLLDICSDVMRNPTFAPEQVERARAELLSALREQEFDTRSRASRAFHELAYPAAHPYHRQVSGTLESVERLRRDDLRDFHERYIKPQGMVITIVGAVKAGDALTAVQNAFGDWEGVRPPRPPLPAVPPLTTRREQYIPLPEKTQADLVLGWPGPERRAPDFLACQLANTLLGVFGMMGRLGEQVRSQNGLAYYVYSSLESAIGPGSWQAIAGVHPAHVEKAIALILDEVQRLREEPVPAAELADNQAYLIGSLPLRLETNEGVAGNLTYIERFELGLDYLLRYEERISAITAADIQSVAQRWLNPAAFALGVSGPPRA